MKTNLKYISILLACAVLSSCSVKAENTEQTAAPTVQTTETQVESSAAAKIVPADLTMLNKSNGTPKNTIKQAVIY